MGQPAFDEHRIWVPTSSGLYEVDRATGHVTWLAYDDGNWFLSVLKADDLLYVATSRGLYYSEIMPNSAGGIAAASSLRRPAKPLPGRRRPADADAGKPSPSTAMLERPAPGTSLISSRSSFPWKTTPRPRSRSRWTKRRRYGKRSQGPCNSI